MKAPNKRERAAVVCEVWPRTALVLVLMLAMVGVIASASNASTGAAVSCGDSSDEVFQSVGFQRQPLTVRTRVGFVSKESDDVTCVWLAGLSDGSEVTPVLAVRWVRDESSRFRWWHLELFSSAGLLDSGSQQTVDLGIVSPKWGHEYETALSYHPLHGAVSLSVRDCTTQTTILTKQLTVGTYDRPLLGSARYELVGDSGPDSSVISVVLLECLNRFVPAGLEWSITERGQRGRDVEVIDRRNNPELRLQLPEIDLPGTFSLMVGEGTDGLEIASFSGVRGTVAIPLSVESLPAGRARYRLQYSDGGEVYYADDKVVIVGRFSLQFGDVALDTETGVLKGSLMITSDGACPDTELSVSAVISRLVWEADTYSYRSERVQEALVYRGQVSMESTAVSIALESPIDLPDWSSHFEVAFTAALSIDAAITVSGAKQTLLEGADSPAIVYGISELVNDERILAEVIQGVANRDGPRLYLGSIHDPWLRIYADHNGLRFRPHEGGLPELIRSFRDLFSGLIVYDPNVDGSQWVAVTLAGLDGMLPVSPRLLEAYEDVFEELELGVYLDLRGRFARSVDAYEWALAEVIPRANRRFAHSVSGPSIDGVFAAGWAWPGFDWVVMNQGIVFNLTPAPHRMNSYGYDVGGCPDQADMYERIMSALEAPAQITGFGEPEGHWVSLFSRYGHYSFHWGTNWSFHSNIPASKQLKQQKHFVPEDVSVEEDKHYVAIMLSEGDTLKGPITFYFGSWLHPERGAVPINWGINPLMATQMPAMMEYYYDTATENDCFFAGTSGAGYAYIGDMDPSAVERFAQHVAEAIELADIRVLDVWEIRNRELEVYASITRPLGLVVKGRGAIRGPAGIPVALHTNSLWYWQAQIMGWQAPWQEAFRDDERRAQLIAALVRRIESVAAGLTTPSIIPVYMDMHEFSDLPVVIQEIGEALDNTRFKLARLDEAFTAIRAWRDASAAPADEQK